MSVKIKRLLLLYAAAAFLALGAFAWAAESRLRDYRLAAGYSAAQAFEEAVRAVDGLSAALKMLGYVTDDALGKSLCSTAHAEALAAETALSVLPFSTQELEQLQGFLNRTGDYAGSLCALGEGELDDEHRGHLRELSRAAADFTESLRRMQGKLNEGSVLMDSRERRLQNIGEDGTPRLSALLLGYEGEFRAPEAFAYDGRYSPVEQPAPGGRSEAEGRAIAAAAAGVDERELKEEYRFEGPEGRRCYSAGGLLIGVSGRGLEYMAQSRLVSGGEIGEEKAREIAERFLKEQGYEELALCESAGNEAVAAFRYAPTTQGVPRRDDYISISVALDDGSIYAFDATRYRDEEAEPVWSTDEETARSVLPQGLSVLRSGRVILRSAGGKSRPCYEFDCADGEGTRVRIYVDAESGRQYKIEL